MKKRYQVSLVVIAIMLVVTISLATSYALWSITKTQTGENVVESGCFDLTVSNESGQINLQNAYPMTTKEGLELEPYQITIKNTCSVTAKYSANIEILPTSDLNTEYVASSINGGTVRTLGSLDTATPTIENVTESRVLQTGVLAGGDTKTFYLRIWLDESVTINDTNAIEKTINTKIVIVNTATSDKVYTEDILNGTDPVLAEGLIPVQIAPNGKVTKTSPNSSWYNYENKEWANAIILADASVNYNIGDEIPETNIESYFVWIPRYKYKLFYESDYDELYEEYIPGSNAKEIEIIFENKTTTPSTGENSGEWLTHPAFTSFGVNGLWIAKFETTGAVDALTVKPGLTPVTNVNVSSMFNQAKNYKSTLDSHMMKNTEWGAAAYLSHSKYGINKNININNNSSKLTGYGSVVDQLEASPAEEYREIGIIGSDASTTQNWLSSYGQAASTTGNVTGIYDMSGGCFEVVAGYVPFAGSDSAGFGTDPSNLFDHKYFDFYPVHSEVSSYELRILGDATGELGPFYNWSDDGMPNPSYHNHWYANSSMFVSPTYDDIWFVRGGNYNHGYLAGQFYFSSGDGSASELTTFRMVLAPNN